MGYGVINYKDGSTYKGQIYKGVPHGIGTFKSNGLDNLEYEGSWKDGDMHGDGKCTWSSGKYYSGEFRSGK